MFSLNQSNFLGDNWFSFSWVLSTVWDGLLPILRYCHSHHSQKNSERSLWQLTQLTHSRSDSDSDSQSVRDDSQPAKWNCWKSNLQQMRGVLFKTTEMSDWKMIFWGVLSQFGLPTHAIHMHPPVENSFNLLAGQRQQGTPQQIWQMNTPLQ